jgi:hypothetical protein
MKGFKIHHLVKVLFFLFHLEKIFGWCKYIFLWTAYMTDISRFARRYKGHSYNDFLNFKRNYNKRYLLYTHLIDAFELKRKSVVYLEFGVSKGHSLRYWSSQLKHPGSCFNGFDTFQGLPEAWGMYKIGDMKAAEKELEIDDQRVMLVKGLFQKSLPNTILSIDFSGFEHKVIHLDADLYSSTLFTLATLFPILKPGDILIFDEFNVPLHEFKAFDDFCKAWYADFEFAGAVNNYFQAAFVYRGQKLPTL